MATLSFVTNCQKALEQISIGDIFGAEGETGSSRICIVLSVSATVILARDISTQAIYEFSRQTGIAIRYFRTTAYRYEISSVAPLPDDIRAIMLALDRRFRQIEYRQAENPNWQPPLQETALTKKEIRAYLFIDDFYRSNPIRTPA